MVMVGIFATVLGVIWTGGLISPAGIAICLVASAGGGLLYAKTRQIVWAAQALQEEEASEQLDEQTDSSLKSKRSIIQALNQPALMIVSGAISAGNAAANEVFNLPSDQSELSVASLRNPTLLSAVEKVLSEGGHAQCQLQPGRRPDEYWQVDITALGRNPERDGLLVILTDQKPVRLAERARADFLANASHE